jgi:predicted DNA-binding transcriptional regulator AlpA
MTKPFNQSLNHDIAQLKILHARKDKTEFNLMKNEVMRRHNISKATVYREMKKDTPGLYKSPRYFPPQREITAKERDMVNNLLQRQFTVQDIINIMERETGENYSWDRIDKIRESITNYESGIMNEKQETVRSGEFTVDSLQLTVERENQKAVDSGELKAENQGSRNIRRVVEELLEADKMTEGETITLMVGGEQQTISRDAARDIALIIANYSDAGGQSIAEMNRLRLVHLITDKIRLVSLGSYASVRELKELCDMNSAITEQLPKEPMTIKDLVEMYSD